MMSAPLTTQAQAEATIARVLIRAAAMKGVTVEELAQSIGPKGFEAAHVVAFMHGAEAEAVRQRRAHALASTPGVN